MGKRVIQVCDLCKVESEDFEVLTIKKPSKKGAGRKYDLCASCSEKIQQQLVASEDRTLPNWSFADVEPTAVIPPEPEVALEPRLEPEEDEFIVARKKEELKEAGVLQDEPPPERKQSKGCVHMNKGPVKLTIRNGERYAYRHCRECQMEVPEKKFDEKSGYLNAKAPEGVRITGGKV